VAENNIGVGHQKIIINKLNMKIFMAYKNYLIFLKKKEILLIIVNIEFF
jgi:hypothetical protein